MAGFGKEYLSSFLADLTNRALDWFGLGKGVGPTAAPTEPRIAKEHERIQLRADLQAMPKEDTANLWRHLDKAAREHRENREVYLLAKASQYSVVEEEEVIKRTFEEGAKSKKEGEEDKGKPEEEKGKLKGGGVKRGKKKVEETSRKIIRAKFIMSASTRRSRLKYLNGCSDEQYRRELRTVENDWISQLGERAREKAKEFAEFAKRAGGEVNEAANGLAEKLRSLRMDLRQRGVLKPKKSRRRAERAREAVNRALEERLSPMGKKEEGHDESL